jgi:hypothetical protein
MACGTVVVSTGCYGSGRRILAIRHLNVSCVSTVAYQQNYCKYRAFHNVLSDHKHLQQANQRTYLNGNVHSYRKSEKVFLTTRDGGLSGTNRFITKNL